MVHILIRVFVLICLCKILCGQGVISEFHYDNEGGDQGEFVEVFWPIPDSQPTNLVDYRIILYNGADSMTNGDRGLQGILSTCDSSGCYYVWETSLQNELEGIALAYAGETDTTLYDFVSYEGTILALDGPAEGVLSMDVEVEEGSDTPVGYSLQRRNDSTWFAGPQTRGVVNPIELSYFDAVYRHQAQVVEVVWETLSENNNAFFEVERSQDGYSFETIGRVWGAGESQYKISYNYIDRNPGRWWPYYRLKQVGFDDGFMYSHVVKVEMGGVESSEGLYVYCHGGNLLLRANNRLFPQLGICIYDLQGKLLFHKNQLSGTTKVVNSHILPEIIVYVVYSGNEIIQSGKLANF
ncbi:hypothetical protein [Membranihabitans maritimus]|uniref:hypothetical protein n=1 Tax=Membranihabitans maritimus TaxID=2904244 RepID=UPI001F2EA32C|nr:hypothetical protein [Membranihabitans maritimus]